MCPESSSAFARPRVLYATLAGTGVELEHRAWASADADLDRAGAWSGSALGLALLSEHARHDPAAEAPLVLAVGECVRRAVPTAARVTVASRAPANGLYTDGQVGGDLASRLVDVCDALVIAGRLERADGAVLVLAAGGAARLETLPELVGRSPAARHRLLVERLGACATLSIGPAGDRGLPFASLAVGDTAPHFVGRGGLGAVLGRTGLAAVAVTAPARDTKPRPELVEALLSSPRLEGRARGGTLELFSAREARGVLRERDEREVVDSETAAALGAEIESRRDERHGCKGCPTPCGWIFARSEGPGQGARFGATHALGLNLGLEGFDDALRLLAACDELGADAKDVGAALALVCTARERGLIAGAPAWGAADTLVEWVRDLGRAEAREPDVRALLDLGACGVAAELGLLDGLRAVRGGVLGPEISLAAFLGQCVSTRGVDPMRTLPFGALDAEGRLAELVAPLELPPGAEDPDDPAGKGRLVWWHENLATALDTTGFCAFSAAALLADGVRTLDELAAEIGPRALLAEGGAPGALLLSMGAELVALQRDLGRRWAGPGALDLPAWTRERLDRPGLWPEYRRLRGLDERGDPGELGQLRESIQAGALRRPSEVPEPTAPASPASPGAVTLVARGILADSLGFESRLELDLPARLSDVLERVVERWPEAGLGDGVLPGVYRAGARVAPGDWVSDGDRLDLVLVISGGSG